MSKSLKDISWNVSESEYRSDKSFSYSKLAAFYKKGARALISSEKEDSLSLRFGSLVDCILTAPEEFDDRFIVSNVDVGDKIRKIVDTIYDCRSEIDNLSELDIGTFELIINSNDYQNNWGLQTKIKKIIESGEDYFQLLKMSDNKLIVNTDDFELAKMCVNNLKTNKFTYKLFDNSDKDIFYQLKFKTTFFGISVRMMADIILVDHKNKLIQPVDLKTTGKDEEKFNESFEEWCYWIQASMYTRIIENIIKTDEYFKDFTVLPFQFCVINKLNQKPLIWQIESTDDIEEESLIKFGHDWSTLLVDADWHFKNNLFEYSKKSYLNNGINKLKLI